MQERYQREGWLLDAAAIYCGAVRSLAGHLASAPIGSPALLAFRDYLASYAASAGFTALAADTRNRKDPLPTSFGEDLYYRLGGWLEETEPCP